MLSVKSPRPRPIGEHFTLTLRSLQFRQPFLDFLWTLRFRWLSSLASTCVLTGMILAS